MLNYKFANVADFFCPPRPACPLSGLDADVAVVQKQLKRRRAEGGEGLASVLELHLSCRCKAVEGLLEMEEGC